MASKSGVDEMTMASPTLKYSYGTALDWSWTKKHVILFIITFDAFLADFNSSIAIPALMPQAAEWHLSLAVAQHAIVGSVFMLGAGGIFAIMASSYFGRLPVIFYSLCITLATGAWCGAATSFPSYLTARILNGFFSTVGQANGLMWIQDIFPEKDHAHKVNILSAGIVVSPYLAPMVGSFVLWHLKWPWIFWVLSIVNAAALLSVILFVDESMPLPTPAKPASIIQRRLSRLIGIEQWHSRHSRDSFSRIVLRPITGLLKVPVFFLVVYAFLSFAWVVGVNATIGIWLAEIYHFDIRDTAIFYIAGVIGVVVGFIVGRFANDLILKAFARRSGNRSVPSEIRLIIIYPATALMLVALVLLGFGLQRRWNYVTIAVCYAVQIAGVQLSTLGVNSYLLNAYPEGSGTVGAWATFGRATGGFMAAYIQIEWVTKAGVKTALCIEGGIVTAAIILIIILQVFGQGIRARQGPIAL